MNFFSRSPQTAHLGWQLFLAALEENDPTAAEVGMQLMARATPQSTPPSGD